MRMLATTPRGFTGWWCGKRATTFFPNPERFRSGVRERRRLFHKVRSPTRTHPNHQAVELDEANKRLVNVERLPMAVSFVAFACVPSLQTSLWMTLSADRAMSTISGKFILHPHPLPSPSPIGWERVADRPGEGNATKVEIIHRQVNVAFDGEVGVGQNDF